MIILCVLGYFETVSLNMHAHDNTFVFVDKGGFCVFIRTF